MGTMKDQLSARNLLEETKAVMLHHQYQTSDQRASFISRTDTLLKRLLLRENPASSRFPRPEHPLFSDQKASNKILVRDLSAEIMLATSLARKVDLVAQDYRIYLKLLALAPLTPSKSTLPDPNLMVDTHKMPHQVHQYPPLVVGDPSSAYMKNQVVAEFPTPVLQTAIGVRLK